MSSGTSQVQIQTYTLLSSVALPTVLLPNDYLFIWSHLGCLHTYLTCLTHWLRCEPVDVVSCTVNMTVSSAHQSRAATPSSPHLLSFVIPARRKTTHSYFRRAACYALVTRDYDIRGGYRPPCVIYRRAFGYLKLAFLNVPGVIYCVL